MPKSQVLLNSIKTLSGQLALYRLFWAYVPYLVELGYIETLIELEKLISDSAALFKFPDAFQAQEDRAASLESKINEFKRKLFQQSHSFKAIFREDWFQELGFTVVDPNSETLEADTITCFEQLNKKLSEETPYQSGFRFTWGANNLWTFLNIRKHAKHLNHKVRLTKQMISITQDGTMPQEVFVPKRPGFLLFLSDFFDEDQMADFLKRYLDSIKQYDAYITPSYERRKIEIADLAKSRCEMRYPLAMERAKSLLVREQWKKLFNKEMNYLEEDFDGDNKDGLAYAAEVTRVLATSRYKAVRSFAKDPGQSELVSHILLLGLFEKEMSVDDVIEKLGAKISAAVQRSGLVLAPYKGLHLQTTPHL